MSIFMDLRDAEASAGGVFTTAVPEVTGSLQVEGTVNPANTEHVALHDSYRSRIFELRDIAEDDEDIEQVNEDSIREFWTFMERMGFARRAGLVLQDNGNLRAVWRDEAGHNVGLEFQGGGSVLYVMFKPYTDGRKTFREADVATFDAVVDKLRELDLLTFVSV
jgi:hypothetical protein